MPFQAIADAWRPTHYPVESWTWAERGLYEKSRPHCTAAFDSVPQRAAELHSGCLTSSKKGIQVLLFRRTDLHPVISLKQEQVNDAH